MTRIDVDDAADGEWMQYVQATTDNPKAQRLSALVKKSQGSDLRPLLKVHPKRRGQ